MNFKDEILQHYLDEDGLVTVDRDPTHWSDGNSLLHTGIFYTLLALRNELTPVDSEQFYTAVAKCKVYPGLFSRNPGRPDFDSHDDYLGVAVGSYFTDTRFAGDIVAYGQAHNWHFDNTNPSNDSIAVNHNRFPGRVAIYKACNETSPGFWARLGINSAIRGAIDMPVGHAGEKVLAWLQVEVIRRYKSMPVLCELFDEHIRNFYGGIGGLFAIAINPHHPFAQVTI